MDSMSGLDPPTVTLDPMTTGPGPTSLCTGIRRWLAGNEPFPPPFPAHAPAPGRPPLGPRSILSPCVCAKVGWKGRATEGESSSAHCFTPQIVTVAMARPGGAQSLQLCLVSYMGMGPNARAVLCCPHRPSIGVEWEGEARTLTPVHKCELLRGFTGRPAPTVAV